jgi:5-methyltetrahydrofolate--homocysteine methyltransferase
MKEDLLQRLRGGGIVVGDGAWGTELQKRGLPPGESPEAFGRERPALLEEIAAGYRDAGAEILTANTFGASPLNLARYSLQNETEAINSDAIGAVRRAAGNDAQVAASVGPSGALLEPYGDLTGRAGAESFERQIRALAESGADLIIVETMTDLAEARIAIHAARSVAPGLPVVATMSFDTTPRGFFTMMGVSIEQAASGLEAAGADAVGSNCGTGIETMVAIAREFRRHTRLPVVIQPNAGLPENRDGRIVYSESPEVFATHVGALIDAGVAMIGGCCGTGPGHIRAIRAAVDAGPAGPRRA